MSFNARYKLHQLAGAARKPLRTDLCVQNQVHLKIILIRG